MQESKGTKDCVLRELSSTSSIQEFQRKLYRKAKAELKFRFYSLYDKTYRMDVLAEAYRRVKANGGTSGVDDESCEKIEARGLASYLRELQLERSAESTISLISRYAIYCNDGKGDTDMVGAGLAPTTSTDS